MTVDFEALGFPPGTITRRARVALYGERDTVADIVGTVVDLRVVGSIVWPSGSPRDITIRHPAAGTSEIEVLAFSKEVSVKQPYGLAWRRIPLALPATSTVFGLNQHMFWDILAARVTAGGVPAGDIHVDRTGDGAGLSSRVVIPTGYDRSHNTAFFVPPGWVAAVEEFEFRQLIGATSGNTTVGALISMDGDAQESLYPLDLPSVSKNGLFDPRDRVVALEQGTRVRFAMTANGALGQGRPRVLFVRTDHKPGYGARVTL